MNSFWILPPFHSGWPETVKTGSIEYPADQLKLHLCIFRLNSLVNYPIFALKWAYWMYCFSSQYFIWLTFPKVIVCTVLGRNFMRFIRYHTSSSQILFKISFYREVCHYLLLGITILFLFIKFYQNCLNTVVKEFVNKNYPKKMSTSIFLRNTLQKESLSLIMKICCKFQQNFVCHRPSGFIFCCCKTACKKSLSLIAKKFFDISPRASCIHIKNLRGLRILRPTLFQYLEVSIYLRALYLPQQPIPHWCH